MCNSVMAYSGANYKTKGENLFKTGSYSNSIFITPLGM